MKETEKAGENKRMRCKYCGNIQPVDVSFCQSCGHDMALFGEVVEGSAAPGVPPKKKHARFTMAACILLAVAAAVFLLGKRGGQSQPAKLQTITTEGVTEERKLIEEAVLPDFYAFSCEQVREREAEYFEQRYSHPFTAELDAARPIFDEYRRLLESRYPYEQMGSLKAYDETEETRYTYYWYTYTGPEDVTELSMDVLPEGRIEDCNIWVAYVANARAGVATIHVGGANEVRYRDSGDRTTIQLTQTQ